MHREIDILLTDWSEWIFSHHAYPKRCMEMMPRGKPGPVVPNCDMPDEQYQAWWAVTTKGQRSYHDALKAAGMFLEGRLL